MEYSYQIDLDATKIEYIMERMQLAYERLGEIAVDPECCDKYADYFKCCAYYLEQVSKLSQGDFNAFGCNDKKKLNAILYQELSEDNYKKSYLNPTYAVSALGKEYGQVLSAIYAEIRATLNYAYKLDVEQVLIRAELFLEIYGMFASAYIDGNDAPEILEIKESFRAFAYDYLEYMIDENIQDSFIRQNSLPYCIVMEANLDDTDYLYDYGEYISETEIKMAEYVNSLPEETIAIMADTYTEGYRKGFIATGKDLSIKKTVEIRYFIGFERVVRKAVKNFEALGLKSVIHYSTPSFLLGRGVIKRGIESTNPGKQFDSDHEQDKVLYYDHAFMERKLEVYRDALERHKEALAWYAGPAVIESFGEEAFTPKTCAERLEYDAGTRKLLTEYTSRAGRILNKYIKGEERSFTIIAFPTPAIGPDFERIFDDIIAVNTLNYEKYRDLQQILIDTLDSSDYVHVLGMNGNRTDIVIKVAKIENPDNESAFENCVADVNIPVGEVFTSPVLEGTQGVLHVKEVFLNGIRFVDLTIEFKDGIIDNIICSNYEDEIQNKKFIDNYILFNHEFLPIGEFAIGTNTEAYRVTRKYGLEEIMPILIAEKTGPHFAVGDTCYSHEEDVTTYNPDGKKLIAKENSYSRLRDTNPQEAYFGCHTDITIPYDELGELSAVSADGNKTLIISQGRFVLPGLEELNKPLERI